VRARSRAWGGVEGEGVRRFCCARRSLERVRRGGRDVYREEWKVFWRWETRVGRSEDWFDIVCWCLEDKEVDGLWVLRVMDFREVTRLLVVTLLRSGFGDSAGFCIRTDKALDAPFFGTMRGDNNQKNQSSFSPILSYLAQISSRH